MRYRSSRPATPPCGAACASWRHAAPLRLPSLACAAQTRGTRMNHKKLRRLYREEKLQVRQRGGRKRALGVRRRWRCRAAPTSAGRWISCPTAFSNGRRFRILAIVDDFTRESLALIPDTSLSGVRVARELDALIARRGRPKSCVSDNGTELTSKAILNWSQSERCRLALHRAGQASAECVCRELHRPTARRVLERDAVWLARSCPRGAGRLEE